MEKRRFAKDVACGVGGVMTHADKNSVVRAFIFKTKVFWCAFVEPGCIQSRKWQSDAGLAR